jgi:hypothetical protein
MPLFFKRVATILSFLAIYFTDKGGLDFFTNFSQLGYFPIVTLKSHFIVMEKHSSPQDMENRSPPQDVETPDKPRRKVPASREHNRVMEWMRKKHPDWHEKAKKQSDNMKNGDLEFVYKRPPVMKPVTTGGEEMDMIDQDQT